MTRTRSPAERRAMFARMGKDYHAMNRDMSVRAVNTLPDTPENRKEWEKDSRRIDIKGIDTPIVKKLPEKTTDEQLSVPYAIGDVIVLESGADGKIINITKDNITFQQSVRVGDGLKYETHTVSLKDKKMVHRKDFSGKTTEKWDLKTYYGAPSAPKKWKAEPVISKSPYKDLTIIADGEYHKQVVGYSVAKDADKLFEAIYNNDMDTIIKYENKYYKAFLTGQKAGTTRDKYIRQDAAKITIHNLALHARSEIEKFNKENSIVDKKSSDDKYIVTAHVERDGKRQNISKPISLEMAKDLKERDESALKTATKENKWAKDFKIEKVVNDTKTNFKVDDTLLNKELLRNAHAGTSFDPEKRAETEKEYFKIEVESVYKELKGFAKTDKQKSELKDEMVKFQKRYAEKFNDTLASRGRMLSPMITGPANFPTRKNEKAYSSYENKVRENTKFRDKAVAGITKRWRKENVADAGGERAVLEKKLKMAQENHQQMKDINVIMRKKSSDADKRKQLESIGVSETLIRDVFKPDFMGRTGFQGFHLQNSNARIKSAKARLASMEKRETTKTTSGTINGVKIVDNTEDNRIQLFFDGKPDDTMRKKLKGSGWRWAPSAGAWQRIRTDNAIRSAKQILKDD